MAKLMELTKVLRSKNAGPFMLTFELLFRSGADLDRVVAAGILSVGRVATLLSCKPGDIAILVYRPAHAIKITIPRRYSSGAFEDSDVFGCQQHAGLLALEVPD